MAALLSPVGGLSPVLLHGLVPDEGILGIVANLALYGALFLDALALHLPGKASILDPSRPTRQRCPSRLPCSRSSRASPSAPW